MVTHTWLVCVHVQEKREILVIYPISIFLQQEPSGSPTPKRPRGRPKGSKNKPSSMTSRGKVSRRFSGFVHSLRSQRQVTDKLAPYVKKK